MPHSNQHKMYNGIFVYQVTNTKISQKKKKKKKLPTLGVCSQPTDPPKPTWPNPTCWAGSVFRAWWVGLGYKIFFDSRSGWVWVLKFQTRQTRPDPSIYLIYIFKKYYIINNFFLNNQLFLLLYIKANINIY